MKEAQSDYAAKKWKEEMDARMNPQPKKKSYFKDINEPEPEEVPEEELNRDEQQLVKVCGTLVGIGM